MIAGAIGRVTPAVFGSHLASILSGAVHPGATVPAPGELTGEAAVEAAMSCLVPARYLIAPLPEEIEAQIAAALGPVPRGILTPNGWEY